MRLAAPISQEWYKRHRWTADPDFLELQYLRGWGEFSVSYTESFERHLRQMVREKNPHD